MRSDCILRSLTPDQLDDLFDWISTYSYAEALARAAKPAPDGFAVRLQRTTVVRFFRAEQRQRHNKQLAELAVIDDTAPEIAKLLKSAKLDFAHAIYDLAQSVDRENFDRLESALHHIERCQIDREHLALGRDRLAMARLHGEFSIAAELLKSAPEYMDIRKRHDIHDENKVWLARERTFGVSSLAPFPRCEADRHPPQLENSAIPAAPVISPSTQEESQGEACHVSRGGDAQPNPASSLPSIPSVDPSAETPTHSDTLKHAIAPGDVLTPPSPSENLRESLSAAPPAKEDADTNTPSLPSFPSVEPPLSAVTAAPSLPSVEPFLSSGTPPSPIQ